MAKIPLLIDTDIWIDYFNHGRFSGYFEEPHVVYFSVVTRKELLAKRGLRESEKKAILFELQRHREILVTDPIAKKCWELLKLYSSLEKEDALIASTAMVKHLPLLTGNWKHFRQIQGIELFGG